MRLKDGSELRTLTDARNYILSLPADQHRTPAVEAAIEALLMAATKTGPILHAQIGMIQLIHGKPDGTLKREKRSSRSGSGWQHDRRQTERCDSCGESQRPNRNTKTRCRLIGMEIFS